MRVLATVAVTLAAMLTLVACGPKDDVPPPTLHKVRTPPEADVTAFEGALKVTGVEISPDGHFIIVRGEAVEDLGLAPSPVTVEFLDASGASLASTPAMLVLDPMPERAIQPPMPAGSKVFITANCYALKSDPAKVVITLGGGPGGPPGGMGPGGAAPPR